MEKLNKFTKIFRKIYYKLFIEDFKEKLNYNFTENFYRWDLIEYLIKKVKLTDYPFLIYYFGKVLLCNKRREKQYKVNLKNDLKNNISDEKNKLKKNMKKMLGSKSFGNTGSMDFFNTNKRRVFWYSYCPLDIDDVVKEILKSSDKYFYDYLINKFNNRISFINNLNLYIIPKLIKGK